VAARIGFCGLDRKREPLQGGEVRACWEDGALRAPPDPVTPGLLDLLTVTGLGEPPDLDRDGQDEPAPSPPAFATTAAAYSGSRRLWVEVEA
jgi:hypothetical protein